MAKRNNGKFPYRCTSRSNHYTATSHNTSLCAFLFLVPVTLVGHVSGEGDVDDARLRQIGVAVVSLSKKLYSHSVRSLYVKHKPYCFLLGNNWT